MIRTPVRLVVSATLAVVAAGAVGVHPRLVAAQAGNGTIKGRVRLTGKSPGNGVIRMGLDPMCVKMNAGKLVVQEEVVVSADGGLANTFLRLQGSFPRVPPVPTQPVVIDQRACFYLPRVVGARVGQTLQVRNSDPMLHNVHTLSAGANGFNVGQPSAGMMFPFQLKQEEVMLRLKCDVHRWMTAFIGVVSHPYFAVSATDGAFEIANVPAGSYTIQTWHERYGSLTRPVRVAPGATAVIDLAYTGTEKAPTAGVRDLILPPAPLPQAPALSQ